MVTNQEICEVLYETFTIPRGKMKIALYDEDEPLYTSDEIKNDFKNMLDNQDLLKPVADSINVLVDKDVIVPVFASKNLLNVISRKILVPQENKLSLGLYHHETKRIYILVENHTSWLYWVNRDDIASVLIHEFQHLLAKRYPHDFITIHKESLSKYYSSFLDNRFDTDTNPEDGFSLAKWIFTNYELKETYPVAILVRYAHFLESILEKNNVINPSEKITDLLTILKLYMTDFKSFINMVYAHNKTIIKVVTDLMKSYKSLGILNPNSLCIQELWCISEVICIESQNSINEKHYQLIDKLAKEV